MKKIKKLKKEIETNVEDPRRKYGNLRHKIEDIIIIGFCTIICGGQDYVDMEEFGIEREEWLRKFLELPNGIPDSDTFRRMFERIKPEELSQSLFNWLEAEWEERTVIAVDGKTIRGSKNKNHKAYHVVSAFVAENHITFGEITVDEKSNEITAVPELLNMLEIEGAVITADSMSCQKKITEKIISEKADYVIGLKQNQPALFEDAEDYFNEFASELPVFTETDKGHGRIEKREYRLLTDLSWLEQKDEWCGLNAFGMVKSTVVENNKKREFIRYFITSLTDLHEFSSAVRKHWSIENQLHWSLDVIFREDASRTKKDNSPLNLNILRKNALPLLKNVQPARVSMKKLMFKAALNVDWLQKILFTPLK